MRNPFSRISPDVARFVRMSRFPGSSYTGPGGGAVAGGNDESGNWYGFSMLDVHPLEEGSHFRLAGLPPESAELGASTRMFPTRMFSSRMFPNLMFPDTEGG